jgi:hypothetical protein
MERPRSSTRPVSSASSQSSFESRYKSPLSTSSSVDYESSRTSEDSSLFDADAGSVSFVSPTSTPHTLYKDGKRSFTEPIVPVRRHGAGGIERSTLITPQRLSRAPSSPVTRDFGMMVQTPRAPGESFKRLPEEILLVILGELKKSHLAVGSISCATCWMRDLTNLGLSSRKWWSAARCMLYEDIQLNGVDSAHHTRKFKIKYGVRLKLLRRTLRARPELAEYVKSLKVPSMPDGAKGKKEQEEYLDLVASVIMACPNLERLPGFYPAYNHTFSRLVHALSTRQKLKEAVWVISSSPSQRQHRYTSLDDAQYFPSIMAPARLLPEQCVDFLTYHSKWTHLKTLFLHCNPGGNIDSLLFADVCNLLPSLENLHVSSFPTPAFNDSTLTSLPPLKSLRLENLSGITANGLSAYACSPGSNTLTSLSLVSLPDVSLPVLARLFSYLKSMTRFTLSQASSPGLPVGTDIYLHPYLASLSLEYLHWEITNPSDEEATDILAKSILYSGFPSLRTIRAPTDSEGTLQKLCKPREKIELPGDRHRDKGSSSAAPSHVLSSSSLPSPTWSTFSLGHNYSGSSFLKSPTRSTFSLKMDSPICNDRSAEPGTSLLAARRTAQQRIDAAQTTPQFHIIIWNEWGMLVERQTAGGFIGLVQSRITYSLKPDIDGADQALVTVDGPGGLLDGAAETHSRDGCTGGWNRGRSGKSGSSKEKWSHTERGRWREIALEKFF